jgi:hypothetical protein
LYINDLPNCLTHAKPFIFADDTNLFLHNTNVQQLRTQCLEDLDCISKWCKLNLLTLNASKTAYLFLSSANTLLPEFPSDNLPEFKQTSTSKTTSKTTKKQNETTKITIKTETTKFSPAITQTKTTTTTSITSREGTVYMRVPTQTSPENSNPLNLTIDKQHINLEENTKFLGIMMNENLQWEPQVPSSLKKIRKYLGIFAKSRHYVPQKILVDLYHALIFPHLTYCIEIWGSENTNASYLQPLFRIQKKIVRIIAFSKFQDHALPIFKKLKLLHIFDLYKVNIAILTHAYKNSDTRYILNNIAYVKDTHEHPTSWAGKNNITHMYYRTEFGKQTMSNKVRLSWNEIPEELRTEKNITVFKAQIKAHFVNNPTEYDSTSTYIAPLQIKKIKLPTKKTWKKKEKEKLESAIQNYFH